MDIQFRCTNQLRRDTKGDKLSACGQLLEADPNHAGLKVRCPQCGQLMVVPLEHPDEKNQKRKHEIVDNGQPAGSGSGTATASRKSSVLPGYHGFDSRVRCRKCGSLLQVDGRCPACYYEAPQLRPVDTPIDQIPVQAAGFQLWFRSIMTGGISPLAMAAASHGLFLISLLIAVGAAIGLGGSKKLTLAIVLPIVCTGLYIYIYYSTIRMARVPAARIPFFLRPFWYLILVFARAGNWTKYDSRLKDRVVIDVRGHAFGDRDLLELDKLPVAQVLDAEGTSLTDSGLALLHGMKNLRCLVVRKTHVSREGVFRLQQAIPRCWIWY
jgi:phage FluMu protein Com